jgi:hypothetical protein
MAVQLQASTFWRFCLQVDRRNTVLLALRRFLWVGILGCALLLTGCSLPQVSAESRLFLNLSLNYLAEYQLPQTQFQDTTVGGLSSLTYDRSRNRVYALASSPPRVYTLKLPLPKLGELEGSAKGVATPIEVEAVAHLSDSDTSVLDLEGRGIALTPRSTLFVVGENAASSPSVPTRLSEFQLTSGRWRQDLTLPTQYGSQQEEGFGIQSHQGLKALVVNPEGERLFTATEAPLSQDLSAIGSPQSSRYSRLLHYWISEPEPLLISEHLYPLDRPAEGRSESELPRLADIVPVDGAGHFLSLERSYRPSGGYSATLYQFVTGVATDTSKIRTLPTNLAGTAPILKRTLLNLDSLPVPLQNLEGMMLGPSLADGSRSLVLASNNALKPASPTQFLIFRLTQNRA